MIDSAEVAIAANSAGLGSATIYLAALDRDRPRLALDSGRSIYPASMIKTPLAAAAAVAVDAGRTRWDDRVEVDASNMTFNDAPSPLEPGYAATVIELVELMLTRSDNVATNVLMDHLGREPATADVRALGLRETAFRRKLSGKLPLIDDPAATGRNSHPAREAADLFERIARGTVPSASLLHRFLRGQMWNTKLSAGLDPADRFAHKTGDTDETSHDGGILELAGGGRYVIVVYSELASNDETDARFAAFMQRIRPLLVEP
ncbi:MAG: serine hydrolase [Candidatus Lustribacter sp.]